MTKLRDTTLVFLVSRKGGALSTLLLAMKKRGFGEGRWNGVGGKVEHGESVVDGAIRETKEEIDVTPRELQKVAELMFYFPENPAYDQLVHVYLAEEWDGEPKESEEMAPRWYQVEDIPYKSMWPDDIDWLPLVLQGKCISAEFHFGKGDTILKRQVLEVAQFDDA